VLPQHSRHHPAVLRRDMASDEIRRSALRAMALMPLVASAFTPHVDPSSLLCKPKVSSFAALSLSNQADDHSSQGRGMNFDEQTNSTNKEKYTVARAGGRRPRTDPKSKQPDATKEKPENGILSLIRDFALPLCVLTVILRFLFGMFGGNTGSPNVVYYSRSIYQSTTYTKDGNIERIRREKFQSNIPELVQQSTEYKQERNSRDVDDESYFNIIDGEFDDDIDSQIFRKW
jgi:hypothetical protein